MNFFVNNPVKFRHLMSLLVQKLYNTTIIAYEKLISMPILSALPRELS